MGGTYVKSFLGSRLSQDCTSLPETTRNSVPEKIGGPCFKRKGSPKHHFFRGELLALRVRYSK